ncbi:MAG TPA: sensor histidine kinase [Planctomycetaceae bacterium]|nr:sensor histidine kinase [Planctomycetaceae bacterium]
MAVIASKLMPENLRRALVVEDEETARLLIVDCPAKIGFVCDAAEDSVAPNTSASLCHFLLEGGHQGRDCSMDEYSSDSRSRSQVSKVEEQKQSVPLHLRPDQLAHLIHLQIESELLVGILHELNQPLTAIAMLVCSAQEVARSGAGFDAARMAEIISKLEVQIARASEITRRLRQMNRRTDPYPSRCDPNLIVKQAVGQLSSEIRAAGVEVQLNLDQSVPDDAFLDAAQIRQVVVNLVRNALDSLEASTASPRVVAVSTTRTGDREIVLEVRDSGLGISPEIAPCLFEPFVTTRPDRLGLGLTVSRAIVEAHSGRSWFERSPNGGARFLARLPVPESEDTPHGK